MSRNTIAVSKFIGTISLGLLTGVSYTLATQTLPSLLTLPSAKPAYHTFLHLQTLAKNNLRTLTAVAITSLTAAYALSPSRGRHPYLLWTALTAAMGGGVDFVLRHDEDKLRQQGGEGENVNGEQVQAAVEQFRIAEMVRTGVSGMAFAMAVVGIWGDGF
ncbi:hypothetical protein BJ546DRAFT_835072 [Cryomyces antarcticus]|uniref:DUF1772 domain-containing protein n=1 Tax=Cryomyces antarcticus TaxID=329879 RepID=A0ABR0LPA9_9PEZI|nr:hypothetical protein LTR60_005321 [Cryomyces antarcticus]KAK5151001.1 hypothetical protein LTR04_006676 [Oleoguttula sp. CCFEE 6159]KAK5201387.1 hypothetical protein LTR16_002849 [Cryomyces antarcticus]